MSNYHPLWAPPTPPELAIGKEAAERAKALGAKSARERDFITAVNAYYGQSDTLDHRTRALAYEKAMERVASSYRPPRKKRARPPLVGSTPRPPLVGSTPNNLRLVD